MSECNLCCGTGFCACNGVEDREGNQCERCGASGYCPECGGSGGELDHPLLSDNYGWPDD